MRGKLTTGGIVQCPHCRTVYKYKEDFENTIYMKCLTCGNMIRDLREKDTNDNSANKS